jgi:hypothetical protein
MHAHTRRMQQRRSTAKATRKQGRPREQPRSRPGETNAQREITSKGRRAGRTPGGGGTRPKSTRRQHTGVCRDQGATTLKDNTASTHHASCKNAISSKRQIRHSHVKQGYRKEFKPLEAMRRGLILDTQRHCISLGGIQVPGPSISGPDLGVQKPPDTDTTETTDLQHTDNRVTLASPKAASPRN